MTLGHAPALRGGYSGQCAKPLRMATREPTLDGERTCSVPSLKKWPQSPCLGAELLLVLEDVGLRAWVLAIAQRCYDCEECCSKSFDR